MNAIALIPVDLQRSRLGLRSRVAERIAGRTVLAHTVRRVALIASVERIILVHPPGQSPLSLLAGESIDKPVEAVVDAGGLRDRHTERLRVARLWAPTAWRGGLGGATVFDELLPAGPLVAAMETHGAPSCLLVGGDWCLLDPLLCEAVLAQHLAAPTGMKLTFSQAPPGLCGVATSDRVLRDLAEHGATFGNILGYNPRAPIADPIGKEANLPIPPEVRDCGRRFVFDTDRSAALVEAILKKDADADASAAARFALEANDESLPPPPWINLELTPRREVDGPITPQHYGCFNRPDLDIDLARRIVTQVAEIDDACLLLRGPAGGDVLLHPHWPQIATAAHEAGVASIGVETDLLCDRDELERLLDGPVDLVTVRLNADTAATYERTMGADRFRQVIGNLEWLINTRNRRAVEGGRVGLPWLLPRMVKTRDTLPELELFFDKWTVYTGHAVVEPACTGCGAMPDLGPVPMAPPNRRPCRQLGRRMTILSDGTVAACDQDWRGEAPMGDLKITTLVDAWRRVGDLREEHRAGRFTDLTLCNRCTEWHRP